MTAEEWLRDYLSNALSRMEQGVDINKGAKFLIDTGIWRASLEDWVAQSRDIIMVSSRKDRTAKLKLARVVEICGRNICDQVGLDSDDKKISVPIGAILIDALENEGMIRLERESRRRDAPWLVIIEDPMLRSVSLRATMFYEPGPIKGLRSKVGPYIKRFTGLDIDYFQQLIEENPPFIQELNKLRNQGWKLDTNLLTIVVNNPDFFYSKEITLWNTVEDTEYRFPLDHDFSEFHIRKRNPTWTHEDKKTPFLGKNDNILVGMKGKRYDYESTVGKAVVIGDRIFYQDYNCDYRGRVYCAESYMQFQGSDIARGMMMFSIGKPYTMEGLRRLKIHVCNSLNLSFHKDEIPSYLQGSYRENLCRDGLDTIGMDKLTLDDRVRWVDNNLPFVLGQTELNSEAENPVAFLAACWELDKAIHIKDYLGNLPVPIDGSNNGWQHLSAMSRDRQAASLVSLTDEEYQKDFYVSVAKVMVNDAKDWFKKKQIPMKKVRKSIAKRGAMTRAYSAGAKAIAENMWADCRKDGVAAEYKVTEKDTEMLSKVLIDAVNEVCKGPLSIMKWLQKTVAHEIKQGRNEFEWITPSGFPVRYQMYTMWDTKIYVSMSKHGQMGIIYETPAIRKEDGSKIPDAKAYASGIAPNTVHSFDAAHLAFTMTRFQGCFGAVHDSFATHASDVDELLEMAKGCFVGMYDQESWFEYYKSIMMKHSESFEVPNPELGDYKIEEVWDAKYFFC